MAAGRSDFRTSYKWRKLRLAILQRDLWTCHWCGGQANEVDHLVPAASGGERYDPDNLVAACGPCNRARGDPTWRPGLLKKARDPKAPFRLLPPQILGDYSVGRKRRP